VALVQSTASGREIWRPDPGREPGAYPTWTLAEKRAGHDPDMVIALSVTHNVLKDVEAYVSRSLPQVGRILSCTLPPAPSNRAIADATHAQLLASQLSSYLKENRTEEERQGQLHIFAAAPNAFVFFLGQLGRSLGPCTLYEYDFETNALGAYQPSLSFPQP
jgi:SMODS-associated and fused to various effectors sensor domain